MDFKIIAVDFDGTLCENKYPEIGEPKYSVIERLKAEQEAGAKVILWTCRTEKQLADAVYWCAGHGLKFDAINENLKSTIAKFGDDTRKVSATEYWDDRAVPISVETEAARMEGARSFGRQLLELLEGKYIEIRSEAVSSLSEAIRAAEIFQIINLAKNLMNEYEITASERDEK